MDIKIEMDDDVIVLIPEGNLVASETEDFHSRIEKLAVYNVRFVLLDMGHITFMDSSGLDAVMIISKHVTDGGGVFVCAAPHDNVLKVFRITWADHKIPIAATRADGLQMIRELRNGHV
ncbi:MAG: STAS domain-containing protein [Desulfuromonadales bacterium]